MIRRLVEMLTVPILLLNAIGGIVGGVWLAIAGEWRLIGVGLLLLVTAPWTLSILMLLSMPIAGIAVYLYSKKNPLGHIFGFLAQFYTNLLILGTCLLAFLFCSRFYSGTSVIGYLPYLLWSWGMALGPWQFFASKEPNNEFTAMSQFSASVFYLLFLVSVVISPQAGILVFLLFGLVQLFVLPIFCMYVAYQMEKASPAL